MAPNAAAPDGPGWGSDVVADLLRAFDLPFVALNPGASFRGLHDSLVNYLGNERPKLLCCLHEEHAVAIAHGYAKVTGQPLGVVLHTNVGLMHASMAIYNAYCDRVPMLIVGATGPLDAARRRPWIDWIHTAADQASIVRGYVKWDDQPLSLGATRESLIRANVITRSYPSAPTFVTLDAAVQEEPVDASAGVPVDLARHQPPALPRAGARDVERAAAMLLAAERPLVLVGRVSRDERAWARRIELVERLGARVVTDLRVGAGFPSAHPAIAGPAAIFVGAASQRALADSDVLLALDWVDLGGTVRQASAAGEVDARVIACSCDDVLHNGWSRDHGEIAAIDLRVPAHPDTFVEDLLAALDRLGAPPRRPAAGPTAIAAAPPAAVAHEPGDPEAEIDMPTLARALRAATGGRDTCLVRLPLGWQGVDIHVEHPLDYLGQDGGAGIGSGPGMAVGAALALHGGDRLPVAVLGDGDFLMGASALWTATNRGLGLLVVVANNRSYYNDEVHQERVARLRGRPPENRWIGQHIRDPAPDLAMLARSLGARGHGPVTARDDLPAVLAAAVEEAASGAVSVVDVWIDPKGYSAAPVPESRPA